MNNHVLEVNKHMYYVKCEFYYMHKYTHLLAIPIYLTHSRFSKDVSCPRVSSGNGGLVFGSEISATSSHSLIKQTTSAN